MGHSEHQCFQNRHPTWVNLGLRTWQARETDHRQPVKTLPGARTRAHTRTRTRTRTICQTPRAVIAPVGCALHASQRKPPSGRSPLLPPPGHMPATEVLTQGKHLKTEWLPGRRKKRRGWNGMGWGMATGRAQKILKLGDDQGWLVPEGSWAPVWRACESGGNARFCPVGAAFPLP